MSEGQSRTAVRRMLRHARLWIWVALTTAVALGLGRVPLFGTLGYELALASCVLAMIGGLDLGAALARELQRMPAVGIARATYPGRSLARSTAVAAGLAVAVAAIPGVIAAVRGLWLTTCDWTFGLECYIAMPLATAALAGALGHIIGVAVGPRRFWCAALAQLPWLLIGAHALWWFYVTPPVFSYNAVLGYFPGNIYDENLQLTAALVWSRLEQLAWLVALAALVANRLDVASFRLVWRGPRPYGRRVLPLVVAALATAGAVTLRWNGGALGYAIDGDDVAEALGGRYETAHFVIHYAKTKAIDDEIELIAEDHELRYAQVVAQLGVEPDGKIESYYFADNDQKARWFGPKNVDMAKPWQRAIFIDHRAFPHPTLRHEIAHAVASEFGDPWFGVSARRVLGMPLLVNPGLIEGLAVAVDWPGDYDRMTPHEAVRALEAMGSTPDVSELMSLRFLEVSASRSYMTAGSFLRYLLEHYGAARLRALYHNGGDFLAAYGESFAQLEDAWRAMIETIAVPPEAIEASRERFRAGSVFSRPCPHATAARRERADEDFLAGHRERAIMLMRENCSEQPEEPQHRIHLGEMLSAGDASERAEALRLWTAIADDAAGATSTVRVDAFDHLIRTAAQAGDLTRTAALLARASELPVEGQRARTVEAERFALDHTGPARAALVAYFFAGRVLDPQLAAWLATVAEPDLGLGHYLLGLRRDGASDWSGAATELDRGLTLGLPGPLFVKNAARQLAITAYRAHRTELVEHAITALRESPGMGIVDGLLATDWEQRLTFDRTGHL